MYEVNSRVQIINHSEPQCNGAYGTVASIQVGYDGRTKFYNVQLDDAPEMYCLCIDDELMEE